MFLVWVSFILMHDELYWCILKSIVFYGWLYWMDIKKRICKLNWEPMDHFTSYPLHCLSCMSRLHSKVLGKFKRHRCIVANLQILVGSSFPTDKAQYTPIQVVDFRFPYLTLPTILFDDSWNEIALGVSASGLRSWRSMTVGPQKARCSERRTDKAVWRAREPLKLQRRGRMEIWVSCYAVKLRFAKICLKFWEMICWRDWTKHTIYLQLPRASRFEANFLATAETSSRQIATAVEERLADHTPEWAKFYPGCRVGVWLDISWCGFPMEFHRFIIILVFISIDCLWFIVSHNYVFMFHRIKIILGKIDCSSVCVCVWIIGCLLSLIARCPFDRHSKHNSRLEMLLEDKVLIQWMHMLRLVFPI